MAMRMVLGALLLFAASAQSACPFGGAASEDVSPCPMGYTAPPIEPSTYTTGMGCECKSSCGATVNQGLSMCDWCYTKGSCGKKSTNPLYDNWDYCVYPGEKTFDAQDYEQKTNQLWDDVTDPKYVGKSAAARNAASVIAQMVTESMVTSFDDMLEVMPKGRSKVIHGQGVMGLFNLEVDPGSKFTGILAPGNQTGIVRMGSAGSLDTSIAPHGTPMFPGMGIKFMRSGVRSASFVALRTTGPGGPWDFFDSEFGNHGAPPPELVKLNKFQQASGCISMVGLSDVCSYTQKGEKVAEPVFPFELIFEPSGIHFPNVKKSNAELLKELSGIPVGSEIFKVYAYESPDDVVKGNKVQVGRMTTTSPCYQSLFGDEHLYFRHQRMEEDFALRPDWIKQMPALKDATCVATAKPISNWQCVPVPPSSSNLTMAQ